MTNQELSQETINEFVLASHNNFEKVERMLAEQPELLNANAEWGETPLGAAAHVANRTLAEYFLSKGAPLDICTAAMLGMKTQVEEFLKNDPQQAHATGAHGFPVLFYPAISGNREIAELLLASGADVNAAGSGALQGAVGFDQDEMAVWLLENGALTTSRNYQNKTLLQVAAEKNNEPMIALLHQYGAAE